MRSNLSVKQPRTLNVTLTRRAPPGKSNNTLEGEEGTPTDTVRQRHAVREVAGGRVAYEVHLQSGAQRFVVHRA